MGTQPVQSFRSEMSGFCSCLKISRIVLTFIYFSQFFSPLNPLRIHIDMAPNGKSTGEADVEFRSHEDAVAAMSKDKNHMRMIWLFFFLSLSPPSSQCFHYSHSEILVNSQQRCRIRQWGKIKIKMSVRQN